MASPEHSLSEQAKLCDESLMALLVEGSGARGSLQLVFAKQSSKVEEHLGRFRVWARNVGAFQAPNSTKSLDHRLRNGKDVRDAIGRKLQDILDSSLEIRQIVRGEKPNRTKPPVYTSEGIIPSTSEDQEIVSSIESSINLLFRLSMLLRQQRPRGRLPMTNKHLPTRDPTLDIRHVQDKFPRTKYLPWLAERLGRSNAERRDIILYRQAHMQRLADTDENPEFSELAETAPSTIATTYDNEGQASTNITQYLGKVGNQSIRTGATSFASALADDGDDEQSIPDLTRLVFDNIPLRYDQEFVCPFCRTSQLFGTYYEWKKHVFSDLQPYVCTFEGCTMELFSSRHIWAQHEMDVHRRRWYCYQCHNKTFDAKAGLAEHLTAIHQVDKNSQLPILIDTCNRPIRNFQASSCPLCDVWSPPADADDNAYDFFRHLGQHLQQLALSALPRSIDELEVLEDLLTTREEATVIENDYNTVSAKSTNTQLLNDKTIVPVLDGIRLQGPQALPPPHFHQSVSGKRTYLLAPTWNFQLGGPIAIGNIISDPFRPEKVIFSAANIPTLSIPIEQHEEYNHSLAKNEQYKSTGIWAKFLSFAAVDIRLERNFGGNFNYEIDKLVTVSMTQQRATISQILETNELKSLLSSLNKDARFAKPIYVVTGIKIATGLRRISGQEIKFGADTGNLGVQVEVSTGTSSALKFEAGGDVVFAYELKVISYKTSSFEIKEYNKGALF